MMEIVLKGMIISFALVSSIGMQNIFVINNAVSNPLSKAMIVCGAIWISDSALTTIAFLGMGAIITRYALVRLIVMLIGGGVVLFMGYGILKAANQSVMGSNKQMPLKEWLVGAWVVAFTNPQAIIDTGVTLGAFRGSLADWQALPFLLGCVIATAIWFVSITLIVGILRDRLSPKFMRTINVISGLIVMGYGVKLLYNSVQMII